MKSTTTLLSLAFLLVFNFPSHSQKLSSEVKEQIGTAIELMDNGKPDEAIAMLKEVRKQAPKAYIIPYEIGYAYQIKGDLETATFHFREACSMKDANDECYAMVGNLLDMRGKPEDALVAYDEGLKKFPESGRLHLEKANLYVGQKEYNKAINLYEKGIRVEPDFPSNYFRASQLYQGSDDEVWGMLYGEIFLNLERTTKRTTEMGKMLFNTYQSEIKVTSDTSMSVSFSKNNVITLTKKDLKKKDFSKIILPFGVGVYEPLLLLGMMNEKDTSLPALVRARTNFLDLYFEKGHNKTYPNVLFDYQRKVQQAGHLEAYNYWVLGDGDLEAFKEWRAANQEKYTAFIEWFKVNPLEITKKKNFSRFQYS